MKLKRRWVRITGALVASYLLTWWPGGWASRRAIADETAARLEKLGIHVVPPAPTMNRAGLRDVAEREGMYLESRSSYDFAFNWSLPILPGVIYSSYDVFVDGHPATTISSIVLWYGVKAKMIGTFATQGWQWGPAG